LGSDEPLPLGQSFIVFFSLLFGAILSTEFLRFLSVFYQNQFQIEDLFSTHLIRMHF